MSINRKNADGTYSEVAGVPYVTKENIGLGKVENKSSEEIRGEINSKNVTDALGYTPANDVELDFKANLTEYHVDNYEGGTAEDRLYACLQHLLSEHKAGTIVCPYEVEITKSTLLTDTNVYNDSAASIYIQGATFKLNSSMFSCNGTRCFCPTFVECNFISNGQASIYDSAINASFINPAFINCVFTNAVIIDNADVVDNNKFVQSLKIINCKFFKNDGNVIRTKVVWDLTVYNTQAESGHGKFIEITRTVNKGTISNCTIEGFLDNTPLIFARELGGLVIQNNYFEFNYPYSIETGSSYIYDVWILSNFIVANSDRQDHVIHIGSRSNIWIDKNEIRTNADTCYLANFEPYTNQEGKTSNVKLLAGVSSLNVFMEHSTSAFSNARTIPRGGWSWDGEKFTSNYNLGNIKGTYPTFLGSLMVSDRLNVSAYYTANMVFIIQIIGSYNEDTKTIETVPVVTVLANHSGSGRGILDNELTLTAELNVTDPTSTENVILTLYAQTPNTGGDRYIVGRLMNILDIGTSSVISPTT